MADEKDDKPGDIFSFKPEKLAKESEGNGQRDETFTIPAFLRRNAKHKETPQSAPIWNDDDFARIAATAEAPKSAQEEPRAPDATAAQPEPVNEDHAKTADEPAAPLVAEADEPTPEPEAKPEPEIAVKPFYESAEVVAFAPEPLRDAEEIHPSAAPAAFNVAATNEPAVAATTTESSDAAPDPTGPDLPGEEPPAPSPVDEPILAKPTLEDTRPELQDERESVASRIRSASFFSRVPAKDDLVLRVEPEIRAEPKKDRDPGFERVEPRLVSAAQGGEQPVRARAPWRGEGFQQPVQDDDEDVSQRWRLGPALDARDIDAFESRDPLDAGWRISEEPEERKSPIRWVLLAFVVAAGGYAVAHQLDNRGGVTALWSPASNDAVAAFAPPAPSALPPAASSVAAPAPRQATASVIPSEKPVIASRVVESPPPVRAAREEVARRAVETPREVESSKPVTLAPGPRTLSVMSAAQTGGDVSATGELVLDVQQRLTRLGYADVPLNGRLDTNTRSAIMAFQRSRGLPMTGLIDSRMLSNLRHTSPAGMRLVKGPEAVMPP